MQCPLGPPNRAKAVHEKLIYSSPPRSSRPNLINRPDYLTRIADLVQIDTNASVDLRITRDLGDVGHEANMDCAPEASPVTSTIKDHAPGIRGHAPEAFVRSKATFSSTTDSRISRESINCSSISINTKDPSDIEVR
jgi:hypothetical protein